MKAGWLGAPCAVLSCLSRLLVGITGEGKKKNQKRGKVTSNSKEDSSVCGVRRVDHEGVPIRILSSSHHH